MYATEAVSTTSTNTEKITEAGLYYFDGSVWQKVTTAINNTITGDISASGSYSHGPYEVNGFLLGRTQRENNRQRNYVGVASGNAWGGTRRAMSISTDDYHTHSVAGTTIASGTHTHPVMLIREELGQP